MTLPESKFPRVGVKPHDPSGGTRKRTLKFKIPHDDTVASGTLTPVDDLDATLVEATTPLQVGALEFFLIVADAKGDVWGCNFYPRYGNRKTLYKLRLRMFFASQPTIAQPDMTFELYCDET